MVGPAAEDRDVRAARRVGRVVEEQDVAGLEVGAGDLLAEAVEAAGPLVGAQVPGHGDVAGAVLAVAVRPVLLHGVRDPRVDPQLGAVDDLGAGRRPQGVGRDLAGGRGGGRYGLGLGARRAVQRPRPPCGVSEPTAETEAGSGPGSAARPPAPGSPCRPARPSRGRGRSPRRPRRRPGPRPPPSPGPGRGGRRGPPGGRPPGPAGRGRGHAVAGRSPGRRSRPLARTLRRPARSCDSPPHS